PGAADPESAGVPAAAVSSAGDPNDPGAPLDSPWSVPLNQSAGSGSVAAAAPAGNHPLGLVAATSNRDGASPLANAGTPSTTVGVALHQNLGPFVPAAPAGAGLGGAGAPRAAAAVTPDAATRATDALFALLPASGRRRAFLGFDLPGAGAFWLLPTDPLE